MSAFTSANLRSESSGTSHSLLRRVRNHDALAWRRMVELYSPLVYFWCRRARLSEEDAADVMQEVFRAVALGIGNFRHDRPGDTFRGWLRTVFRSKLLNFLKAKQRQPDAAGGTGAYDAMQQFPDTLDDQEDEAEQQQVSQLYQQAMSLIQAEFEETTWRAFYLMTVEEQSAKIVAAKLGLTTGAAHTARWRVLRRLRQELGDFE